MEADSFALDQVRILTLSGARIVGMRAAQLLLHAVKTWMPEGVPGLKASRFGTFSVGMKFAAPLRRIQEGAMTAFMDNLRHAAKLERQERRAEARRRTFKGATLRFNGGYSVFDCIVRDQSASGARLSFGDSSGVPARFELKIAGEDSARTAIVRWRNTSSVGVFLG